MASRASAATVKSNLRALRLRNRLGNNTATSSNIFTSAAAARLLPAPVAMMSPRRHQQERSQQHHHLCHHLRIGLEGDKIAGFHCLSSTSTVPQAERRLPAGSSAAEALIRAHQPQRRPHQPFCTNTTTGGSSSDESGSSANGCHQKLDVHVTHVDAKAAAAADGLDDDQREMMPEEDRMPIGAGSPGAEGEKVARFLDVPGSEQTREEKMTIVFTCTVCETRTAKTFAKLSYEKGVVITRCPGCHNLHLIADRLGWFEEAGDGAQGWDIEKITNLIGESECHVVNEDNVMELNLVDIVGKSTKPK